MAGVKFMLMYPLPQEIDTFEHLYQDEDVPIGALAGWMRTELVLHAFKADERDWRQVCQSGSTATGKRNW